MPGDWDPVKHFNDTDNQRGQQRHNATLLTGGDGRRWGQRVNLRPPTRNYDA